MKSIWISLTFLITLAVTPGARAFEEAHIHGYVDEFSARFPKTRNPVNHDSVRMQKYELVLNTLGIPQEPEPDFSDFPSNTILSQSAITARLPYLDPDKGLARYFSLSAKNISLFLDFFSAALPGNILEYALGLGTEVQPSDSENLINHLDLISKQVKDTQPQPLTGLKIVIDPGHMGTDHWDTETGKYVAINCKKDGHGTPYDCADKVSEGELNLWTAYLVANELEALGATVILTRDQLTPVSRENPQTFNLTPYIDQYFYDGLDDWMPPYLKLTDAQIKSTIKRKPQVEYGFSENHRSDYFVEGEDLHARSQIVDQQKPDIMLDIHYDAANTAALQSGNDSIEAFVPGSFRSDETGSRKIRSFALKQLLDMRRWQASVDLSNEVVNAMSVSEKLPLLTDPSFLTATRVQNGVYARNLYLTRRNLSSLMVYVECLHYDNTREFPNLLNANQNGNYHGISFQYPARLNDVAAGIRNGFLNYFKR